MAEGEQPPEGLDEDGKPTIKEEQKFQEEDYHAAKCNMRIEELAKPNKAHVKTIYCEYRKILPERNVKAVLLYLREEFAKSPEETEVDFNKIEHKQKVKKCRKICKKEARRKHMDKMNENKRKNMLNILTDILRRYITRAYFKPKQIIMTARLRRISNVVLKELCNCRGIPVPKRESTNIRALLMFAAADYFAYCIDTIYYELQVMKVSDYETLQQQKAILSTSVENNITKI